MDHSVLKSVTFYFASLRVMNFCCGENICTAVWGKICSVCFVVAQKLMHTLAYSYSLFSCCHCVLCRHWWPVCHDKSSEGEGGYVSRNTWWGYADSFHTVWQCNTYQRAAPGWTLTDAQACCGQPHQLSGWCRTGYTCHPGTHKTIKWWGSGKLLL